MHTATETPEKLITKKSTEKTKKIISSFIENHFRHFNAATLVDAAKAYNTHLEEK